jgi:methylenetetrahydrofolate dehydrogenase (NADP+)/methenyltetrahydrofolate cyclohydrolase
LTELLKGGPIARELYIDFRKNSEDLKAAGLFPKVRMIIASDDPAVQTYSAMITKNCQKGGIDSDIIKFGIERSNLDVLNTIKESNNDRDIHGIIVMLPLWKHLDEKRALEAISPVKDIDGVNPYNAGKTVLGDESFTPNTAQACKDILQKSKIELAGKHVVIIGRSNIVGKPLANMLIQKGVDATVTVCHSRTINLKEICRSADIIVAAIGSPLFITQEFTNPEQIIVDVGMNEIECADGSIKLAGDVDFENVKDHVKAITPVPGGVSPLTHTALIKNVFRAISLQRNEQNI